MCPSQKDFYKKLLGKSGEKRAVEYLKKAGHTVLERNYTTPFGEIDIITRDGEYVVFTEVKTRKNDAFGSPAEAVNAAKIKKYGNAANYYLLCANLNDVPCRFDVIEITGDKINHIKDAFFL